MFLKVLGSWIFDNWHFTICFGSPYLNLFFFSGILSTKHFLHNEFILSLILSILKSAWGSFIVSSHYLISQILFTFYVYWYIFVFLRQPKSKQETHTVRQVVWRSPWASANLALWPDPQRTQPGLWTSWQVQNTDFASQKDYAFQGQSRMCAWCFRLTKTTNKLLFSFVLM